MNNEINFFAETTFRNQRKRFGIRTDDRFRHIYIVGKTEMGKTAMMMNMAIQDIQQGKGIGFIDPLGRTAEALLDFIPSHRINEAVYFNPADLAYPISLNIVEKTESKYFHLIASNINGIFKKIWPNVWSSKTEYILNNCIFALLEYPNSTLLGINRMLADSDYRKRIVDKVSDPLVRAFWVQEYPKYIQKYETEAIATIQNKFGQLVSTSLIRNIIGQLKSSISIREIIDKEKILIVNLSKEEIGEENAYFLGGLLITKLQIDVLSRKDLPEEQRKKFFLYIDEFQNFITERFANILTEAKRFRIGLILGHQYLSQLDNEIKEAIFENIGTTIAFRVGAEDAQFLAREFTPEFDVDDLTNLAKYNIYLKLMINGMTSRPFSAETLPPMQPFEESNKEKIIKLSREKYGCLSSVIEGKISRWLEKKELFKKASYLPTRAIAKGEKEHLSSLPLALYSAKCVGCQKEVKTMFKPDGTKPIYCKTCLVKSIKTPVAPKKRIFKT